MGTIDKIVASRQEMIGTVSAPVLSILEAARTVAMMTDMLGTSSSNIVFGVKSVNSDPICEGIIRIVERKVPLLLRRELIPGDPRSAEVFDVRSMVLPAEYLNACLSFRMDSMIPENGMTVDEIVSRLGKWAKPTNITGAYSMTDQ